MIFGNENALGLFCILTNKGIVHTKLKTLKKLFYNDQFQYYKKILYHQR